MTPATTSAAWTSRSNSSSPSAARLVGTGVALYVERAGGQFEEARVSLDADGHFVAHSATGPHGQGHATTFAQIVADELQIDPDRVELRFDEPEGAGTFGGRATAMGGSALLLAARELRAKLDAGERPPLEAHARFESDYVFSSGAYAAVVEIDPETGALRVKRIAAVDDAGTIVNHELADGPGARRQRPRPRRQPARGVRPRRGRPAAQRQLHRVRDAVRGRGPGDPHRVRRVALAANPLGAKGIGEGGSIGVPAALGNAVADAIGGIRVDPPIPPRSCGELVPRCRVPSSGRVRKFVV